MSGSPSQYTLHTSGNKLFLQAHEDYIMKKDEPLCHIWGKYHTSSEVSDAVKKKVSLMPSEVNNMDYEAYYSGLAEWTPQFTMEPTTLTHFVDYLESNGVNDFTFVCHEIKAESGNDVEGPVTINISEKCSFKPLPVPPKTTPTHANFGSKLPKNKVNWKTGEASGGMCNVKFHLQYADTTQLRGIKPGKPAFFLKNALRVKKGKVYAVVW